VPTTSLLGYPRVDASIGQALSLEDHMAHVDIDDARAALIDERATVIHQLHELGADESGNLTGDVDFGDAFADAGAATAERNETIGIVSNLTKRLDDVDTALTKIDEGTFGVCMVCGKDIGTARMEFRPSSVRCVDCKTRVS
jgi:RNA polymerase-binding transcription factor DksA